MGGSRLPCRGQEAPQSALTLALSDASPAVNITLTGNPQAEDDTMTHDFPAGNYRFIPSVFQYSGGAAADPGFEVERVRFHTPVPLAEGFARIEKYITEAGRPLT